jgi:hypothetical protein
MGGKKLSHQAKWRYLEDGNDRKKIREKKRLNYIVLK